MYESFFGLTERPFSIAPDPQYLYMSARHKEAMAHLSYGLSQGGCFIVLTGEVGTGKTTLCRNLLMDLPDNVDVALLLNANINETELLQTICDELKIDYESENSQKQLLDLINQHLLDTFADNRHTVMIIDEAQLLSRDVLEQIRLLTNLETTKSKLLQIILIGQPELNEMLTRNDLRQLTQRVTARYHLGALKPSEIEEYVNYRLGVAGCRQPLFTKQALSRLHQITDGIPRKINVVADQALLSAYSQSEHTVGSSNIKQASEEVFFNLVSNEVNSKKLKWTGLLLALVLLNVLVWWFFIAKDNNELVVSDDVQSSDVNEIVASQNSQQVLPSIEVGSQSTPESVEDTTTNGVSEIDEPVTEVAEELAETQSGSVILSEEFLDAEDGVVETVQNPEIMQSIDFIPDPAVESTSSTADNPPAPSPQTEFGRVLETSADRTGRIAAFRTLTELWGAELPDQVLSPICTEAASLGLRCLGVSNWSQLMRYNRPATLVLDHNGQLHRVVVEKIDGEAAEVRVGDAIYRIGVEELQTRWNGAGLAVWRPSQAGFEFLQLGDSGPAVASIRADLNQTLLQSQLPTLESLNSTLFDQDMAQKVFALQSAFGIISDSKIGSETYLLVNETVSPSASPVLRKRTLNGGG